MQTSLRTASFTDSVIRRMTRVCLKYDAINLSQGFPDFDPPAELTKRLSEVALSGPHQYAVTWGAQNVREALAAKIKHFSGQAVDPNNELVITCGSTEAMMASVLATVNPGEKVAIFSPFYENYGADSILCDAQPVYVPLKPPSFTFDPAELEQAFAQGAKALILCNPSNPCGKVFTREELETISDIIKRYDAFVITDEVYEHLIFKPHTHTYLATLPGMKERTLVCNSFSKTYSITGWRLGYVQGPAHIIEAVRKVHDFLTVGAAAPLQEALIAGLTLPDSYYEQLQETYAKKRELFCSGLDEIGLEYYRPQGAYYVLVDIGSFGYDSDVQFCEDLARKVGVGAVPGSSFFKEKVNNYIRFHFAKKEETLTAALERLKNIHILKR
ncbi:MULTISPECIES: aminotransferase class I/II-fold pyridoxal phosphate-dependent enzyme [unclassified Anaerobiospirillum]|uniref:pyridoxal phosphate-dependent aminotransferase n=1 Tax=unclassified Anaerobiospirillum TaxID=2647410 RepID=UPI001FF374A0|nr:MULTISPECIES: aminotransferase class I/II-fold pyridoxal phosphate-dependent enzyme [unclassified Anaerobiospirillum]MCK0535066.1 aminotransferase class I/II-fold pyridoxal phosphate-dependent enzyme [Anaerobiospirillum sp. NML120511]MCK0540191.1 aminotransferase class I/II-fold pyridoxal phosphate-dependent enzyme [Anaerobiospirillum sp. NML02-A-032]